MLTAVMIKRAISSLFIPFNIFTICFLQEYGIKGFPTIKVFVPGKPPVDYQGAREVKPIAEFAVQQVLIINFKLANPVITNAFSLLC